ncbi:hypothetical protein FJ661_01550 [Pseudarthrobacter phenanthrenivorans]|uniref:hypothetical protein n=1 Tax=Pseudarthrobacter phenanthrenivorans TaxID=361575 RepID=UPI0011276B0C|nr:hypothetical protein [Pseudarthrobacter phenanthrenivorans]TPV53301.1 hypothetical protein FJ661_01550 [Pseudarthrobacter phenanthrenivorans]
MPQPPYTDPGNAGLSVLPHPATEPLKREAVREEALRQSPGIPILMLRRAPVKVRSSTGHAIAYTVTHVLVEREDDDGYHVRWEAAWMVRRLPDSPPVAGQGA